MVDARLSVQGLQVLREAMGGVPALVSAVLADLAEGRREELVTLASTGAGVAPGAPTTLMDRRARDWALRVVERDGDDRLALLLTLLPPLPLETTAAVVDPAVPVRTVDRVHVLTVLGDWDHLDVVLAQGIRVLASLTRAERTALVRRWPRTGDGMWPHLAAGRAFLNSSWRSTGAAAPRPWDELGFLYRATDVALLPPAVRGLPGRVLRLTSHAPVGDGPSACADLEAAVEVLTECVLDAHRERDRGDLGPQAHEDRVRILSLALQGAAEACLGVGMVLRAQQCLNRPRSLGQVTPWGVLGSRRTEQGLRVRLALLAAVANLPVEAADHLAAYEAGREPGPCDDGEACLARAARLLIDAGTGASSETGPVTALTGRGLSSTQIADELGVGTETVRTLTKRLYRRLDVHTRREAVRAARERGLLGRTGRR